MIAWTRFEPIFARKSKAGGIGFPSLSCLFSLISCSFSSYELATSSTAYFLKLAGMTLALITSVGTRKSSTSFSSFAFGDTNECVCLVRCFSKIYFLSIFFCDVYASAVTYFYNRLRVDVLTASFVSSLFRSRPPNLAGFVTYFWRSTKSLTWSRCSNYWTFPKFGTSIE